MRESDTGTEDGKKRRVRCAIYTRKSTTEGLDTNFSSLDSQREACEKFIESQKGEGWVLWPERYDDGGYSGGNTERPALQKLLEDVRARRFDCIVVYKVDRLSRSLMDFARMVELLDRNQVAFVSTTQSFNTSDSIGRLTLHILLSFAQFEREVISERVKTKMTGARKRGKWVGGRPPLGYDVDREKKRLVVNKVEARLVRQIFDSYLERRSILDVVKELNHRGLTSKRLVSKKGNVTGGRPFQATNIQQVLANTYYLGKTEVNGELYPGEHEAIVPDEVFREVEKLRKENLRERSGPSRKGADALLKGMLRCRACGCAMPLSYTRKNGKRYQYFICSMAQKKGYDTCPNPSMNAQAMEEAAVACLRQVVADPKTPLTGKLREFFDHSWEALFPAERIRVFRSLIDRVEYDGRTRAMRLNVSERGAQALARELDPEMAEVA